MKQDGEIMDILAADDLTELLRATAVPKPAQNHETDRWIEAQPLASSTLFVHAVGVRTTPSRQSNALRNLGSSETT
ncbi:hypothetical protein [Arthrobacter sp. K5]|uniref:Uncharacterized protein n=1 Tax=Arthrobacter sp. K5 TaxID=2839623 RepID=A0AAU8EZ60_9MICC